MWSLIVGTWISGIVMMYAAESARLDATIETSHIDKREYLVLKHKDQQQAANTLARIKKILDTLVSKLEYVQDEKKSEAIRRLLARYESLNLVEAPWKDGVTSYTTNKGQEIAMCLRSKSRTSPGKLHDMDTLTYVAIHEMAHVMAKSYSTGKSHNKEFYDNFRFLLHVAHENELIKKTNYLFQPEEYCGIMIAEKLI